MQKTALLSLLAVERKLELPISPPQQFENIQTWLPSLLDLIQEGIWIASADRAKFLFVNSEFERIWMRKAAEIYRDPALWYAAIHMEDRSRLESSRPETSHSNAIEFRIVRPDGSIRWIRQRTFLLKGPKTEFSCLAGIFEDVTDWHRLEDQFRQAQKLEVLGLLAGGVAHDFNNLLTVMRGRTEIVLSDERLSADGAESLSQVLKAADRAANLTRQLVNFSRKQQVRLQPLDLNNVITNLAKLLRHMIGEDINIELELTAGLPDIRADQGLVEQILLNIAVNARDAMPEGGDLIFKSSEVSFDATSKRSAHKSRPGRFLCLSANDTGCGISPEVLPRIFEPFFTTKGPGKGTGLGLAVVDAAVAQLEGWIDVQSEPGRGTTFQIYLPTTSGDKSRPSSSTEKVGLSGGFEKILIVEDDQGLRKFLMLLLQRLGYKIHEANSGREAIQVWKENEGNFDLLLTDVVMPSGLGGWALLNDLRKRRPGLPALVISGYSQEVTSDKAVSGGRTQILMKPFTPEALAQAVRESLDGRKV